jgi:hypothetical protein
LVEIAMLMGGASALVFLVLQPTKLKTTVAAIKSPGN